MAPLWLMCAQKDTSSTTAIYLAGAKSTAEGEERVLPTAELAPISAHHFHRAIHLRAA